MYAPPSGCLLLAEIEFEIAACGTYRKLAPSVWDMKRLYVRPVAPGTGARRCLAEDLVQRARYAGHTHMRRDTLPHMQAAQSIYR